VPRGGLHNSRERVNGIWVRKSKRKGEGVITIQFITRNYSERSEGGHSRRHYAEGKKREIGVSSWGLQWNAKTGKGEFPGGVLSALQVRLEGRPHVPIEQAIEQGEEPEIGDYRIARLSY